VQGSIQSVQIVFLLLLTFVVAFATLARKLQTPYPIVLVIAGLLLGFVPGIPQVTLDPDLIFFVVLPPLLYSGAWNISWRDFRYNLLSIMSLAIGLVAFTTIGVAEASRWILPGFDRHLGWVLGAVVAPTDAVAATSIAKRLGLPQQIVDVLEGESLMNDATGLLALELGVAILVRGQTPTIGEGLWRLTYLIAAGIGVGLLLGRIVDWFERMIDDAPIEIAISILVPYVAYLAAETIRTSGVVAVVVCGLYLSRNSSHFFSPSVRLQAWAVWESLTFILNGLVFVLIGLQLRYVRAGISSLGLGKLLLYGALFSGLVIALRLIWVFPAARVSFYLRRRLLHQHTPRPPARQLFVIGWTGMRGVISLAAALALPEALASGEPFPHRKLIVFLTFSVILVTLVLQGLTLPRLIRALGLAGGAGTKCEEREARRLVVEAALEALQQLSKQDDPRFATAYEDLELHYRERLASLNAGEQEGRNAGEIYEGYLIASRRLLAVERETAIRLRNEGRISDDVLRRIENELDLEDTRMERMLQGT
jgi:Na+/H+ antiporter